MKRKVMTIVAIISSLILFQSCEDDDFEGGGNEEKISSYNEMESHKTGENCMECHKSGGNGEGWFNIAGTVYDALQTSPFPNTTVKLYSGPNATGNLVAVIEVDGLGNFYTTNNIDFGNGLFVSVIGNQTTENMVSSISSGKCNSCHGVNTDRIWTK